jgi:hypothetical protein
MRETGYLEAESIMREEAPSKTRFACNARATGKPEVILN